MRLEVQVVAALAVLDLVAEVIVQVDLHEVLVDRFPVGPLDDHERVRQIHVGEQVVDGHLRRVVDGRPAGFGGPDQRLGHAGNGKGAVRQSVRSVGQFQCQGLLGRT